MNTSTAKTLPDGTLIELCHSDAHTGPNREYGQRCGSAIWWRANGGEWRMTGVRSMFHAMEWMELSDNLEDFKEIEEQ